MDNRRVLFVDDEVNVLSAIERTLRGQFVVETAADPLAALTALRHADEYPVIVSDMRMPGMNGAEFLKEVRRISPDSVRVMLTGNADQQTAIDAVNKGEVFRFLNKPTNQEVLTRTLELGLRQHHLIKAERDLLENTLNGSVKVLSDVLAIANPGAFGRTESIRKKALELAAHIDGVSEWEIGAAASLSFLGFVGLQPEIIEKYMRNDQMDGSERIRFIAHPLLAARLVKDIPRMAGVADILLYQHKDYNGKGFPPNEVSGTEIPIGARIMRVVLAFDELKRTGASDAVVYEELSRRSEQFDPDILRALRNHLDDSDQARTMRVGVGELIDGMTIQEDVLSADGLLLVCEGQRVTPAVRAHFRRFAEAGALTNRLLVTVPPEEGGDDDRPAAAER